MKENEKQINKIKLKHKCVECVRKKNKEEKMRKSIDKSKYLTPPSFFMRINKKKSKLSNTMWFYCIVCINKKILK